MRWRLNKEENMLKTNVKANKKRNFFASFAENILKLKNKCQRDWLEHTIKSIVLRVLFLVTMLKKIRKKWIFFMLLFFSTVRGEAIPVCVEYGPNALAKFVTINDIESCLIKSSCLHEDGTRSKILMACPRLNDTCPTLLECAENNLLFILSSPLQPEQDA